ncbi:outer membrane protein transport protein [Actibacterium sp. D379-3]
MKVATYIQSIMLMLGATAAQAGNTDLSGQSITPLFEQGTHVELGFSAANVKVSGTDPFGGDMGEFAANPVFFSGALKGDINDRLSYALIMDTPFYAEAEYRGPSIYQGLVAKIDTKAVTGLLRYKFNDNWSVHGGVRAQSHKTLFSLPVLFIPETGTTYFNYSFTTDTDYALGYVIGGAFEIPMIHGRASLTYNSKIKFHNKSVELGVPNTWQPEFPESVNFEFLTGINPKTFVFGGARWVHWEETEPRFPISGLLLSDLENMTTYRLGAGRIFSDKWIGVVELGYEPTTKSRFDVLNPVNGFKSIALGAVYSAGKTQYTVGVNYVDVGDAKNPETGNWTGNSVLGAGVKVAYKF